MGPMPQYNALTARSQGGCAFIDSAANVNIFAGDAQDLYQIKSGSTAWGNVSKSSHAYGITSDMQWQFVYFNGDVLATDFADPIQAFTLASSAAFADLAGTPPRARYIAVVKNAFVAVGNTFDGVNGNMPQRVWWCAAGNAKSWPTLGSPAAAQVQSSAVDLLGPAGWVQGFASDIAAADALVFQQYGVRQMIYAGPPEVFAFLPAQSLRGTPAPYSIVTFGGLAYYLGQDGFYATDGSQSIPIGVNKIDRTFFEDIDFVNLNRVIGLADPVRPLIFWAYPGAGNNLGNPNRLLIYHRDLQRWTICDITCETLVRLLSIGYTLDQLYTVLGYTLDNLPAPLDSSLWTGGKPQLGLFDTTHTLNFLSGPPLAATVESTEMQPVPGRRAFVRSSRPLVDGVGTIPSVSIGHRERQQDAVTYSKPSLVNAFGTCPMRASGRYLRASVTVPAGETTWTGISGVEIEAVPQGTR